jgi:PPOX class probable F420-dependent enzyme
MAERESLKHANQLSEEIKALIRGANFAHLATLMRDGAPQVDPVWVDLEGDAILVSTRESHLKAKNTHRDTRVGLSIVAMDNPYQEAQMRGRVIERRSDRDLNVIDRLARKYTGKPFPFRDKPEERLVLVIAVERARYLSLPFVHAPAWYHGSFSPLDHAHRSSHEAEIWRVR